MFTLTMLQQYATQHFANNANPMEATKYMASCIEDVLSATRGITFGNVVQATRVKTAATYKDMRIVKVSSANVIIANNLNKFTNYYRNKVEKEIGEKFELTDTWFEHTSCYSIVQHKTKGSMYLYAIFNGNSKSAYINADTGLQMNKEEVAKYLTPSSAKKMLNPEPTYNVKNNVEHNVIVRTVGLENVIHFTANGETIS